MAAIIAPVTPDLLNELIAAESALNDYHASGGSGINDAKSYVPFVRQLESLAQEVLTARSSVSLINPVRHGAAFHVQSGSSVSQSLDRIVPYLGGVAANLLRHDGSALSRYEKTHTQTAVGHLSELHGCLVSDIRTVASRDLALISTQGVAPLVEAASLVGQFANGERPGPVDEPTG